MKTSFYFLLVQMFCATEVFARTRSIQFAQFGETGVILGDYDQTIQDFGNEVIIDLYSPRNRSVTVRQNSNPLPARFVSGSTGGPFVAMSNFSYIVKLNETANDLIAKVAIPFDKDALSRLGVSPSNTYVAKLANDNLTWYINEIHRNVEIGSSTTRSIKQVSLDGEYRLLGRQTVDQANIFVEYGVGADMTVNITGGVGRQDAEFVDGLRLSIMTPNPMGVNIDLQTNLPANSMPAGTRSLNSFAWAINSTAGNAPINATIRFPVNRLQLPQNLQAANISQFITVGRRSVQSTDATPFVALDKSVTRVYPNTVYISNFGSLQGQYVILVNEAMANRNK